MSVQATARSSQTDGTITGLDAIDLDASASSAPTAVVVAAVVEAMSCRYGNPSSDHHRGDQARSALTYARDALAHLIEGAFGEGVTFTSGCTEANNLVLSSYARRGARIITSAVEHPSVLAVVERIADDGGDVAILPVNRNGRLDLQQVVKVIQADARPTLVSLQIANSETGILQDVRAIAEIVGRETAVVFHSDAAQAIGKVDIAMGRHIGPDILTMSGHKLHAPMGVGAVVIADDADVELAPLLMGGEQEGGRRAGTQAVPAIAGLGAACAEWRTRMAEHRAHLAALQALLETRLSQLEGITINGTGVPRLPNVSSVTIDGCDAMALIANLDARGVAVSQGSACSSRRPEPSHVLRAMGLSEAQAFSTVRFSLSVLNNVEQIERATKIVAEVVAKLRSQV